MSYWSDSLIDLDDGEKSPEIYYKVCVSNEHGIFSLPYGKMIAWTRQYHYDSWTESFSKLFVFDNYSNARKFVNQVHFNQNIFGYFDENLVLSMSEHIIFDNGFGTTTSIATTSMANSKVAS